LNNLLPWMDDDRLAKRRNDLDEEEIIDAEWEEVCPICQDVHERVTRDHCPAARRVRSRLITFGRDPSPIGHVLEDLIEVPIENWLSRRRRKK
jgi:hypothetical protein